MKAAEDILLLADEPVSRRLGPPDGPAGVVVRSDPFAALEELARREYRVVMLAGPRPNFGDLFGAVRRLQPGARLFGLCSPAGEPDLLDGSAEAMEDYFIIPPTPKEWQRILGAAEAGPAAQDLPASRTDLPSAQIHELIHAARDRELLADCVARLVGAVCQARVAWSRVGGARAGVQQLLVLDDDPPRVLWAEDPLEADDGQAEWLSALRGLLPALATTARRTSLLRRLAITDDLTGAFNRRYFMHFARQLLNRARRERFRVTLLVYDIDDFKTYNDRFGHAAGDEILRETAGMMKKITRRHDLVARIGGDEFAVLFWDAGQPRQPNSQPPQTAYALTDRFRQAVTSHQFQSLGPSATGVLTISGGLASFPWDGADIDQLLARADEALLRAKADGKNLIYLVGGGEYQSV